MFEYIIDGLKIHIIIILAISVCALSAYHIANEKISNDLATIQEDNYTCYYNGEIIDTKEIDLHDYNYNIDTEKKAVYLTDEDSANWFPLYIAGYWFWNLF